MELKDTQTERNLRTAYMNECRARSTYLFYADAATKDGFADAADIFLELSQNEGEHARAELDFLQGIADARTNLEQAAHTEHQEHVTFYPEFALKAREEGLHEVADFFERIGKVEGRHEEICRQLSQHMGEGTPMQGRTVGHSAVTMAQLMLPHQANTRGFVHGGELMKMADNAAGVVGARHARSSVVTARVEELNFLKPVRIRDVVMTNAKLTFVARSSMEVRITLEAEDLATGERPVALTAYFIMVALDEKGKALAVPPLLITTEKEQRLFDEGQRRYESHRKAAGG